MGGQGYRMKCFRFRAANCSAVPPKSLYRPSSGTALWAATASPLQAGVDICCDGLNIILNGLVAVFQGDFNLPDGVEDR